MISRRAFFGFAAGVPVAGVGARVADAAPCDSPSLATIPVRKTGSVEIAFKSPGPQPNGLQATKDGLWIIDQSAGSKAYLVDYADGRVLRSFETDTVRPSGITFDGEALWIGSTFSYENVRCNAMTGAVLERRPTPGSIMYTMAGDPPQRRSPLAGGPMAQPRPAAPDAGQPPLARLTQAPSNRLQGAHGQEWRDGKLWTTSTSARSIFEIEAKSLGRAQDPARARKSSARPGARRPISVARRFKSCGVLQVRHRFGSDRREDPIERLGSRCARTDDLERHSWYCDDVGVVCRMRI